MNNYLAFNDGCVNLSKKFSSDVTIMKIKRLVDNDTGEAIEPSSDFVVGHTYTVKNFWEVTVDLIAVKRCETEYEAHKVLEDIISKLSENNNVIIVD